MREVSRPVTCSSEELVVEVRSILFDRRPEIVNCGV